MAVTVTETGFGRSRGGLTTKIHMVTASDRAVVVFSLSGGNAHDAPEGEILIENVERFDEQVYMLMDRAYEGEKMREKVTEKGFIPVVPPKKTEKNRGSMIASYINEGMRSNAISCV